MAYGGRVFNQVAPNALPDKTSKPPIKVKDTLTPVSRESANIEAEKGETAFFLDVNGLPAHYKIGGNRHSKGGTPLNVPEDTFIFSDTKSMTIKDPDLLKQFGETKPKTPAEIAKKYDLNTYRKVLADRDTEAMQKKTAEQMIQNYTLVLGKLALVQESMKGFPQGIPVIAQPYMVVNNISPEDILPMSKQPSQEQGEGQQPEAMEMEGQQGPPPEMMQQQGMGQEMMPPMGRYGMQLGRSYNPFNSLSQFINSANNRNLYRAQNGVSVGPGDLYNQIVAEYNDYLSGPAEAWNEDPSMIGPDGGLNMCLDCHFVDWNDKNHVIDVARLINEGYSTGFHEQSNLDTLKSKLSEYGVPEPKYRSVKPEQKRFGGISRFDNGGQGGPSCGPGMVYLSEIDRCIPESRVDYYKKRFAEDPSFMEDCRANGSCHGSKPTYEPDPIPPISTTPAEAPFRSLSLEPYYTLDNRANNLPTGFTNQNQMGWTAKRIYKDPSGRMHEETKQFMFTPEQLNDPNFDPSNPAGYNFEGNFALPEGYGFQNIGSGPYPWVAKPMQTKAYGGPSIGDPMNVRVYSTDAMNTSDTNGKYRGTYTNANVVQNLDNPYDISRNFTREGRLGLVDYSNNPGSTDLTWYGPFGRRHEVFSQNPVVNFAAESFVNPSVDSYAGYTNPEATPFNRLKKFVTSGGRPLGNYAAGGSTQKRKVRIVSLPTYDNGGPKTKTGSDIANSGSNERKTVLEFSPKFIQDLSDLAEQGKVTGDFPQVEGWTPEFQQRNANQNPVPGRVNIYGDRDWWKENSQERADFERRHKWFLDQNPGWNPENKKDVEKFQRAYCSRMKEFGAASCWFVGEGKGGKGIRIDGVFGEHTWSAPSLNEAPPQEEIPPAEIPPKENKPPQQIPAIPLQVPPQNPPGFEYYPQDVLNLATAFSSQIPNPKTNYYALQFRGMDPAYLTPDYSPYMEAENQRMQGLQAYGSRQGFGADASVAQAKTAEMAAQHNLEVANRNVGIYNSAQQYNAEIANKNAMYNAEQRQADFDTREAYKADRIKAINKKRADIAQLYNNMLDNATAAYNLNLMYPHYQTSPSRGGLVTFYNPEMLRPDENASISQLEQQVNMLRKLKFKNSEIARILSGKNAEQFAQDEEAYNNPYNVPFGYMPHSPMTAGE